MRVIHWFRNDLRIADNTEFAAACRRADALARFRAVRDGSA